MIPLGDVIPVRTRPYITFLSMAALPIAGGLVAGPPAPVDSARGALSDVEWAAAPALLQIASNVVSLWIFGRTVEDRMGHGRFAAFCGICGGIAATAQAIASATSPMVSAAANGAVAGVIGAYFVLYPQSKVAMLVPMGISLRVIELPAVALLAIWFLTQSVSVLGSIASLRASPVPGLIPSWAHVVGIAIGAGAVIVFRRPERQRVEWWNDLPPSR